MTRHASLIGIFALALVAPLPASAQGIPVWARDPGPAEKNAGEQKPLFVIDLDTAALRMTRRFDAQYGREVEFLGLPLRVLLANEDVPRSLDLALLHFGRGMIVPVHFRDETQMRRLDPFVARSARLPQSSSFVQGVFPPIPSNEGLAAVVLHGNKVVTSALEDSAAKPAFAPWKWVDSLVSIELVQADAYFAQFDVAPEDERAHRGFLSYKATCQHCHGLRGVGAAYGPDFVEPTPAYQRFGREEPLPSPTQSPPKSLRPNPYLPPKQIERMRRDEQARERGSSEPFQHFRRSLYAHVKFGRLGRKRESAAMPQLPFITEEEASALWDWLRAVAKEPLATYAPSH